jgi:hypothetical protein
VSLYCSKMPAKLQIPKNLLKLFATMGSSGLLVSLPLKLFWKINFRVYSSRQFDVYWSNARPFAIVVFHA